MNEGKRAWTAGAAAIAAALAGSGAAWAQTPAPAQAPPASGGTAPAPAVSETGSNWRVECTNDGSKLDCRAVFQVFQRDSHQLIAAVAVRMPSDTHKPVMILQLPLGIHVPEPATVQIGEGKAEKFIIQTCTPAGCFASAPISEGFIGAMRAGRELKLSFHNLNRQTVTVTMSLIGFSLAYEKIK